MATQSIQPVSTDVTRPAVAVTKPVSGDAGVGAAMSPSSSSLAAESVTHVAPGADAEANRQKGAIAKAQLDTSLKNLNDYMQQYRRELQFVVDKESGETIVKVVDSETNKVIRQIPSEEVVAMARHLSQQAGMIIRAKV